MARAKAPIPPGAFVEDSCFDAQQAVEKAFKALFVSRGTQVPRTHDLAVLLTGLRQAGWKVPETLNAAARLSPYASAARYPLESPVTPELLAEAVAIAEAVVEWCERSLAAENRAGQTDR